MLSPAPLLLLFGLAAGPLGTGPSADGLDDFVERVREGDPERGLAVLEDLQPAATERLVAVLARIEPLAEESFLSFQERELLLGAIDRLDAKRVLSAVERRGRADLPMVSRLDLIEIAGATEDPRAVGTILTVFGEIDEVKQQNAVVRAAVRSGLARASAHRKGALQVADAALDEEAHPVLVEDCVRALGETHSLEVVPALERILGQSSALEEAVVHALGELEARVPSPPLERARDLVERSLLSIDSDVRVAAAGALARLGDFESAVALADALADADLRVRLAVQAALVRMTGRDFGRDDEIWLAWTADEADWLATELPDLAEQYAGADPAAVSQAQRVLLQHPWHAPEIARALGGALDRADAERAAAICAALAGLGGPTAVELLIEVADDPRAAVRSAALAALAAATDGGPLEDAEAWRRWAGLDG